jgi:hypothetical protein
MVSGTRSAEFALRSYVYLLLHAVIAGPMALLFGSGTGEPQSLSTVLTALVALGRGLRFKPRPRQADVFLSTSCIWYVVVIVL